jgi:hypothetical protein
MRSLGRLSNCKDELRTGVDGRLKVTFRDDTVLTLGEKASIIIDRYVYDPDQNVGETVLHATKGLSLRLRPHQGAEAKKIAVSTLVADIGARGTEFWGGPLDNMGC